MLTGTEERFLGRLAFLRNFGKWVWASSFIYAFAYVFLVVLWSRGDPGSGGIFGGIWLERVKMYDGGMGSKIQMGVH